MGNRVSCLFVFCLFRSVSLVCVRIFDQTQSVSDAVGFIVKVEAIFLHEQQLPTSALHCTALHCNAS